MKIRRATAEDISTLVELNAEVQEIHRQLRPDLFKPSRTPEIAHSRVVDSFTKMGFVKYYKRMTMQVPS
jgi:hypothetical protein